MTFVPSILVAPQAGTHRLTPALRALLPLGLALLTATKVLAATYYVAPTGNDTSPGTAAAPWKTIQNGANKAMPGDTVVVRPGEYTDFVKTARDGTTTAKITFQGEGQPILGGFSVSHAFHVIRGFHFNGTNGTTPTAVYFQWTGSDALLADNVFDNTRANQGQVGLRLGDWGNRPANITISGNRFLNTQYYALTLQGRGHLVVSNYFSSQNGGDAIYLHSRDTTLLHNTFENWSRPPGTSYHTDLIQAFAVGGGVIATNNVIDGNVAYNCIGTQIGNLSDDGYEGRIAHWIWRNNIWVNVEAAMNMATPNMNFYNNLFYRTARNTAGPLVFRNLNNGGGRGHNGRLHNNIFFECGSSPANVNQGWYYMDTGLTNMVADRNLVIGLGAGLRKVGFQKPGFETSGLNGIDPQFVSPLSNDFLLKETSPIIGAGIALNHLFSNDRLGQNRGTSWEIGPYELVVPGSALIPSAPTGLRVVSQP